MRRASGARYAIAFKMAILSLVCLLPQVPVRAAAGLSSTIPQAVSRPTANSKLSTTPSSSPTNTAQSPVLHRTENVNSETWTPNPVVGPTTKEGDGGGFETPGPSSLTEVARTTDKGVAVVEKVCNIPENRCDDVMVRKHGMCGCTQIKTKKVKKSGIKKRSVLNKYRPQLN